MSAADFTCKPDCQHRNKPWPPHLPMPTCRQITEYETGIENPVTRAVYRDAIRARVGRCDGETK